MIGSRQVKPLPPIGVSVESSDPPIVGVLFGPYASWSSFGAGLNSCIVDGPCTFSTMARSGTEDHFQIYYQEIGEDAVLAFDSTVGNGVQSGAGAVVNAGVFYCDSVDIPPRYVAIL
jgi:hypothetical protein